MRGGAGMSERYARRLHGVLDRGGGDDVRLVGGGGGRPATSRRAELPRLGEHRQLRAFGALLLLTQTQTHNGQRWTWWL
jgi:hypothetical protein